MPGEKGTRKTDAQRAAERKYKAGKYKTAACQLEIEKYTAFQKYAASRGKTISALLSEYINHCLSDKTGQE